MIHYLDKTFCTYWETCQLGNDCHRALTYEIVDAAEAWWGDVDAPVSVFVDQPPCFVGPTKKETQGKVL